MNVLWLFILNCSKDRPAALACILSVFIVPNNRFYCMFSETCNMTFQVLLQTNCAFYTAIFFSAHCLGVHKKTPGLLEYFVPSSRRT